MEHLEVSCGGERSLSELDVDLSLHCFVLPIVGERAVQHEGRDCSNIPLVMKCFPSSLPVGACPSLESVAMVAEDLMFSLPIWSTCLTLQLSQPLQSLDKYSEEYPEPTLACGECGDL